MPFQKGNQLAKGNAYWLGRKHTEKTKKKIGLKSKGRKASETTKKKISLSRIGNTWGFKKGNTINVGKTGEKSGNWKGNNVQPHWWIYRKRGNAKQYKCEAKCSKQAQQWSNKDHKYRKILKDWWVLCKSCHVKYDRKNNKLNTK